MGVIKIEQMEFYAFHGHFREEQIVGNRFLVDLEIETNMEKAAASDQLEDAVDYQMAYKIVREEMKKKSYLKILPEEFSTPFIRKYPGWIK